MAASAPSTTTRISTTCRSSRCGGEDGSDLTIDIQFPGRKVIVKVWQAQVGHVTIYLLDTDLPENNERDRDIAHRLYGGDRVTRLEQEFVLGVGGARALAAIGHKPTVWHINEGHAAFLVLERIRSLVAEGLPLDAAHRGGGGEYGVHHAHAGAGGTRPFLRNRRSRRYVKSSFPELEHPRRSAARRRAATST